MVVLAPPVDGVMNRMCGLFVTGAGGVGQVQSAPGLLRAGRVNFKVRPRTRSPFAGIRQMLFWP